MGMKANYNLLLLSIVLFSLLSISITSASQVSNPRQFDKSNLGDELILTGLITLDESVEAAEVIFRVESDEASEDILLLSKIHTFQGGIPVTFSQINKGTLKWEIPNTIGSASDWRVRVSIAKGDTEYQNFTSDSFTITNDLSVFLGANSYLFNLGETLEVSATVLNAAGFTVSGFADISLEDPIDNLIVQNTTSIEDGYATYSYTFQPSDLEGRNLFKLSYSDDNGNSGSASLDNLIVSSKLQLTCDIETPEINPGETFIILGTLKNVHNDTVPGKAVRVFVNQPAENLSMQHDTTADSNGKYAVSVTMPKQAVPGLYPIEADTSDGLGNTGKCSNEVSINPVKSLNVSFTTNTSSTYEMTDIQFSYKIKNLGNVDTSGVIDVYLDTAKVHSIPFTVKRGVTKTVNSTWTAAGPIGDHKLMVLAVVDEELFFESPEQDFQIKEKKFLSYLTLNKTTILIGLIMLIAAIIYFKRKDIKEHFWNKEFQKKLDKAH